MKLSDDPALLRYMHPKRDGSISFVVVLAGLTIFWAVFFLLWTWPVAPVLSR